MLQSWQRHPTPTLSLQYPPTPAQASHPPADPQPLHHHQHHHQVHTQQLAEAREAEASPEPMAASPEIGALNGAAAETLEAQEEAEPGLATSPQDAALQHCPAAPVAPTEEAKEVASAADEAAGGAASAEAADSGKGLVEEPHYGSARGLRPSPVARALAGPTVHVLLEGYVSH